MTALVLDAGALVGVDRADRETLVQIRAARRDGQDLLSNAMVVAQVWRDRHGRQVQLARLLRGVHVRPVDEFSGRAAGLLLAAARLTDAVDATVALLARDGDRVLTSDPDDLRRLLEAAGTRAEVVSC